MIPDDQVEEVRARADIVDVIGEFVPLKKSGKDFKARCPFHEERTPSFYVVPEKGIYNCFGCGESGDVFSFLMKRSGLGFVDAVKHVAERSGVEIRETRSHRPEDDPNRPLYEALAFARDFFRRRLEDPEDGRRARDYLESRGIDAETAERFGLGWAPDDWRALRDAAATHGMDDDVLLDAGLVKTSEKAPEPYDAFRDRIVFPIEDPGGRTVAFGARLVGRGEGGPKYLNSPETPVYHKGEVVYGLSWAKHAVRRERAALVVEGYMDVVSLAAAGIEHAVAPLGTALTREQAALLARYAKRVLLLFDSDPAGLRATFRAGDVLLAAGLHPAVVTLPDGEDPDTLVRKEGAAGLRHYVEQAVDLMDRKLQILDERDFFRDIERTRSALDRLLPTLRAVTDPALRDLYVARVAARTGVRRETLEADLERSARASREAPRRAAPERDPPTAARRSTRLPVKMGPERSLLLVLLANRDWVEQAAESVGPEHFTDAGYRGIFERLLEDPEADVASEGTDPAVLHRLEQVMEAEEDLTHARTLFSSSIHRLRRRQLDARVSEVRGRLERAGDEEERRRLLEEFKRLDAERRALA